MSQPHGESTVLPYDGEVFVDARDSGPSVRTLRISWHHEIEPDGMLVLSLWRSNHCVGTFRVHREDVPLLIEVMTRG